MMGEVAEDGMEEQKMSRVWYFRSFVIAWIVLMTMPISPVGAVLVAVDADTMGLYSLDPETGAATLVGNTGADVVAGLAYDPIPDLLYATTTRSGNLYSIDYTTGAAALIGELGFGLMHGLAYDSSTETLLGTYGESAGDGLYSIDVSTGATTLIGHVGFFHEDHLNTVCGLAVHPETHVLYGVASGPARDWSALVEIDKKTGVGTLIGEDAPHLSGLAFDMQTHILYGIDNWTGDLYSIDIGTGRATLVGSTGLGNPLGLADVAAIPEPATVCLLALGSLIFFRTARE